MAYDLYPAVDEQYQFPPEIRMGLSISPELRNTVVPMTTAMRNNLAGADLWEGRVISNTTTIRLDRYDADSGQWYEFAYVFQVPASSQVIKSFGSDAERDAGIPVPVEGQLCYRTDMNCRQIFGETGVWRRDSGTGAIAENLRYGFAHYYGPITTTSAGLSQTLDLSQGGMLLGNIMSASALAIGVSNAIQISANSATITAVKFKCYDQTGAPLVSTSLTVAIGYMARLAY